MARGTKGLLLLLCLALSSRPALVPEGRRGALIAPVLSLARGGAAEAPEGAPSWISELRRFPGLFEDFEAPQLRWLPLGPQRGDKLIYPDWMSGTWKVSFKKRDVRFPQGWGLLSAQVPGVNMASILRLPNVGAEPKLLWRFRALAGGAEADWGANLGATLEGFWPDAHVLRAEQGEDAVRLTYEAPTALIRKDRPLAERTVASSWLGGDSFQTEQLFYSAEWIRQTDLSQGQDGVADYKVLTSLSRQDSGVTGRLRVAAFLQPVDDGYFEADGKAVAVYDYDLQLFPA